MSRPRSLHGIEKKGESEGGGSGPAGTNATKDRLFGPESAKKGTNRRKPSARLKVRKKKR